VLAAGAVLIAADYGCQLTAGSVAVMGPLDEVAHLLTMLFVLWAVGCRVDRPFAKAALVMSVAIDADHVPQYLGWYGLTQGTPRPYAHSLLTILILAAAAVLFARRAARAAGARWSRLAQIFLGLIVGVGVHLWRDMAEPASGVSLLWPVSYHSFRFAHWTYVVAMAAIGIVCATRADGVARAKGVAARL
jgi:hypothetical protein